MARKQCAKCPWKKSTNPRDIPNGYSEERHRGLACTIAAPGSLRGSSTMACHETPPGAELPCVGWLVHQLGPGNNLGLRMAVIRGRVDANVETDGPQHARFEDTLPLHERQSAMSTKNTDIRIVILQRGFVVVGRYRRDGEYVTVDDAAVIRRWGTDRGLGQLAQEGPRPNTILDTCGRVEAHALTVIMSMPCEVRKWAEKI